MPETLYNSMVSYIGDATGLDDVSTTFTIVDTVLFPDTGNYRLSVDSEIMVCTAHASGTLTVERGVEGTTASAHAFQAAVFIVWTAQGVLNCIAGV